MKVGVLVKQVPDTETKIRITDDGSGIETGDIKWVVNPYDEYAIEQALKLKEKEGGEVFYPRPALCTDNGAMIAFAGWQRLRAGQAEPLAFKPRARWLMEDLPPV